MSAKKDETNLKNEQLEQEQGSVDEPTSSSARSEFHRNKKKSKNIMGSMIWVVVILAIASLAYYMTQRQDFKQNTANTTTTQVARNSSSKAKASLEASKASSKKKAREEAASEKKASEDAKSKKASVTTESHASVKKSSKNEKSNSKSSSAEGASYATVEAGQGLYRIAVNNGISVQELMQLNGLNSNSDIEPGQQLRVR